MYSFNVTQIQRGVLHTVVASTVVEDRSGAVAVLASAPCVKTLIPSACIILVSIPGLHPGLLATHLTASLAASG